MNHIDLIRQLLLTSGKSITDATDIKDLERFIEKFRPKSVGKELIRMGGKGYGAYLNALSRIHSQAIFLHIFIPNVTLKWH